MAAVPHDGNARAVCLRATPWSVVPNAVACMLGAAFASLFLARPLLSYAVGTFAGYLLAGFVTSRVNRAFLDGNSVFTQRRLGKGFTYVPASDMRDLAVTRRRGLIALWYTDTAGRKRALGVPVPAFYWGRKSTRQAATVLGWWAEHKDVEPKVRWWPNPMDRSNARESRTNSAWDADAWSAR